MIVVKISVVKLNLNSQNSLLTPRKAEKYGKHIRKIKRKNQILRLPRRKTGNPISTTGVELFFDDNVVNVVNMGS